MAQQSDYIIIDYMYRDAQNSKTGPRKPMIFFNPNRSEIEDIQAKLREFGLFPGAAIIFRHTFGGLIEYEKLTPGLEEEDWYDDDGDNHGQFRQSSDG